MIIFNKKTNKAFTLIELLVVVAIIGLLSSVVMASLNGARSKARDVKRKAELKQMQTALELYYDTNSVYPINGGWMSSELNDGATNNGGNWIPGLAPTYISTLPKDPRGGAGIYSACAGWKSAYLYRSDGANYKLLSHCAPENSWLSSDSFYDPNRPTWAWMICSGGSACSY